MVHTPLRNDAINPLSQENKPLCVVCKQIEIRKDQKVCFDCFKKAKNLRHIRRNELVLDCDNQLGFGNLAIRQVALMMCVKGYRIEIWNHQGKSYHIHIKDIPFISELPDKANVRYKELVIKKYIAEAIHYVGDKDYFKDFDFSVCRIDHLIAEENKPHHRSKQVKKLVAIMNTELENKCEKEIYNVVVEYDTEYKPLVKGDGITAKIIERISIVDIAKRFGLEVDSSHLTVCPFHPDTDPSLKFYEDQGRFICFGCQTKGNIILFYALMKKIQQEQISK